MTQFSPNSVSATAHFARYCRVLAVLITLVAGTVVAHWRTATHLDTPKIAPAQAWSRYSTTVRWDDNEEFASVLEQSAESLRSGKLLVPISDFDCPLSFLLPGGLVILATDWPPMRVMNLFGATATFLSGVAAFALFRRLGAAVAPACVTALGYQTMNFVCFSQQQGHMNYVQLMWW